MLYTIGHRLNYLQTFRKMAGVVDGTHNKGKGGFAVRSIDEARQLAHEHFPDKDMAIFGIYADWETDTVAVADGWWHNLSKAAPIVMLSPAGDAIEWPVGSDEAPELCRA
ncbi:MAG: hypothetical protein HOM68_11760 [Gemmatimonadetes bacterium]|jgi:hypothetical protein|nr:hypothetical protein [Gemmatimonadota bacterium]MBT4613175.1 hypothetical protein [Gemmatimonadota bacterium]MBT5057207.1 hypothetical protein [Gemmatimonadota bacterium]MBT5143166.1 hypothetical protein [Gemmatimonadota bacterium]MBT5590764.1 hypothetical protein [Gemmatimonadota bacterium]